jgi:methyl-accepting chemotaxis protein
MMISFGITFLVIGALLNGFAWWSLAHGHDAIEKINDQTGKAMANLATTAVVLGQERNVAEELFAAGASPERIEKLRAVNERMVAAFDQVSKEGSSRVVDETITAVDANLTAISGLIAQAARGTTISDRVLSQQLSQVSNGLSTLVDLQNRRAQQVMDDEEQANTVSRLILGLIGLLSALGAFAVVYFVSHRMSRRIERVADAVDRLSDGDMTVRTADDVDDEIGRIARSFNVMVDRLQASTGQERQRMEALNKAMEEVSAFVDSVASGDLTTQLQLGDKGLGGFGLSTNLNRMVDGLAGISSEVASGTKEISSSASEILAIVSNQNSATAEQAASITQTSVTIDEVSANSEQMAARANELAEHARRASVISSEGGEAVDALLSRIDKIGRRMDVVTVEVRELAERSAAIGAINETVTGLADQSNMLALNATIEAARAGEQGRGFAVVADQVRSLAEQSKQATMQVQAILQEIQQATARAVAAADSGARAVADGRENAGETGHVITQLGDAVRQTAEVAVQIAAGAREQEVGMDQIGNAMEDVRDSTMKLASSASDTEAAAGSLNALADRLASAASRYRL